MKCPKCFSENPSDSTFCAKCGTQIRPAQAQSSSTQTLNIQFRELSADTFLAERYRIIEKVGSGGMGVVYKAEDTKLRRIVAIKLIRPEFTVNSELKKRFIIEARAAASLDHPNICTVFEISESEGLDYLTMAYIDGQNLDQKLEQGRLDLLEAVEIAAQVAEGLDEAHEKGIIHRDIKSANIMLSRKGQPKIMDFGLAKLAEDPGATKTTKIVGTVAYMSPEQAKGEIVDKHSDVWSLGVVLYEMLTGHLPFKKESTPGILYSIVHKHPKPLWQIEPSIPVKLSMIVEKCLEKNPLKRYSTAGELAEDLKSVKQNIVLKRRKALALPLLALRLSRLFRKTALPLGVLALLLLLLFLIPDSRQAIRSWLGGTSLKSPEAVSVEPASKAAPMPPAIAQIDDQGKTATINAGSEAKIRAGDTGHVYYTKKEGQEESVAVVAQCLVKDVSPDQSKIEFIEVKEDIKEGYLVEIDPQPRGILAVDTDPDSAYLFVENELKGATDATLILKPGAYRVNIRAKNYTEISDVVQIASGMRTEKRYRLVPLVAQLGTLKIDSVPSGAEVFLGSANTPKGKTPFEVVLSPGRHLVRIRKDDYEEQKFADIVIRPGEIYSMTASLNLKKGALSIETTPAGASVFWGENAAPKGQTPFHEKLDAGEYEIKINKEGYEEIRETIPIHPGESSQRSFQLVQKKTVAQPKSTLIVNASPKDAIVYVNNKRIGTSPAKYESSEPKASITLRIEKEGFKRHEEVITLDESMKMFSAELRPIGKGTFKISSYPQALVEVDGKPLDKPVPPEYLKEVAEGEHKLTFLFEQDGVFTVSRSVKEGETLPVHYKVEDWMREQRALYEITGHVPHESIRLKIDQRTIGDGNVPPAKKYRVEPGDHVLIFSLISRDLGYADLELHDTAEARKTKHINIVSEVADFREAEVAEIPQEYLANEEKDWITVQSQPPVIAEVNHRPPDEIKSSEKAAFWEQRRDPHHLKLNLRNAKEKHEIEIRIYKIMRKKLYKINLSVRPIIP